MEKIEELSELMIEEILVNRGGMCLPFHNEPLCYVGVERKARHK